MNKRILILMGRFFPKASPNSICLEQIVELLNEQNIDITCICYDDGLTDDKERNISVHKIKRGPIMTQEYRLENQNASCRKTLLGILKKIKQIMLLFIYPWNDPIFTFKVYKLSKKLYSINEYDLVLCIHMPISSVIVGHLLKRKYSKIKFVPYFLDSLSGGRPFRFMPLKWNLKKKCKWEEKLLSNADSILVMESSRKHHEKYNANQGFYKNLVFLDIPLIKEVPNIKENFKQKDDQIIVLFCGTANYPMRNVKYFLDIINCLEDENICFMFIGESNCSNLFENKNVKYLKNMKHDELIKYYEKADFLLNLGVKTPSAISGKIFEYMSYGKPIISTYSIDEEACIPYLNKYPIKLLIDERVDFRKQSINLYEFIMKNINKHVDFKEINEIYFKNTPDAFINEINNVLNE